MKPRQGRWQITIVVIVLTICAVWAVPAAANLTLAGDDDASVAYTDGDGVNVREAARNAAGIIATLPEGFTVSILDGPIIAADGSAWYSVSAETAVSTIEGWVAADYLAGDSDDLWIESEPPIAPDDSNDAARGVPAIVNTSDEALNLRAEASSDADVLLSIPDGVALELLEPAVIDDDGIAWSQVRYDGLTGYVVSAYLSTDLNASRALTAATADEMTSVAGLVAGTLAVVSGTEGDGLFVRAEASDDASAVSSLEDGDTGQLTSGPVVDATGGAWYQIETIESVDWVRADYLTATPVAGGGAVIVDEALAYLGVPYLWGGTTPDGFDCSGFSYYILSHVLGYDIARPIEEQMASGNYVAPEDLLPGDLIFFQNTYQWGLSHVGIYIGDGQFISATGQFDAVGVSDLDDPYWSARYLEARRIR